MNFQSAIIKSFMQRLIAGAVALVLSFSLACPLAALAESIHTPADNASQNSVNISPDIPAGEKAPESSPPAAAQAQESPPPTVTITENPNAHTSVSTSAPTTATTSKTDATISNAIDSTANSGDAIGSQNTTVGDITSGNADAFVTMVNMLQSSVNLHGNQPIVFTHDVTNTVIGDLVIDPTTLASLDTGLNLYGDGSSSASTSSTQATIANTVNAYASSGDAAALQNTTVGNVQTGSANSIVNAINLINSAINANQSFIGMVNIYGNLNGNILVPSEFVDNVMQSSMPVETNPDSNIVVTTDNNATVTNHITTNAQSGAAISNTNSTSGTAGTGDANTKITVLNLTSSQTASKNALLVFVNVMGTWVGLILDAPQGSTSAALGNKGAIQSANPNNQQLSENNLEITNTINASARSGDANGSQNTTVGNIQSGDANAGVNLVNILNSQISLSDWFGILFINVFGTWHGNFGVQTATSPNNPTTPSTGGGINFVPSGNTSYNSQPLTQYLANAYRTPTMSNTTTITPASEIPLEPDTKALSLYIERANSDPRAVTQQNNTEGQGLKIWWIPFALVLLAALIVRYIATRRRKQYKIHGGSWAVKN